MDDPTRLNRALDRLSQARLETMESAYRLARAADRAAEAMEGLGYALYEWPDVVLVDILDAEVVGDPFSDI